MPQNNLIKNSYEKFFSIVLILLVTFLFLYIIKDFIITLTMAFILSALFKPLHNKLTSKYHFSNKWATLMILVMAIFIVIIPLTLLVLLLSTQVAQFSSLIKPTLQQALQNPDSLKVPAINWLENFEIYNTHKGLIYKNMMQMIGQTSEYFGKGIFAITSRTMEFLLMLLVAMYAFCYFTYQNTPLYKVAAKYFPYFEENGKIINQRILSMSKVLLKSIAIIGVAQGFIIAVTLAFLGIPAPAVWGVVIVLLSPIPGLGAGLVWFPVVLYLLWAQLWWQALVLLIIGLIVSLGDNFIRPYIIGTEIPISTLLLLVSILGGVSAFGVVGLMLGPLLLILFTTMLDIYRQQN